MRSRAAGAFDSTFANNINHAIIVIVIIIIIIVTITFIINYMGSKTGRRETPCRS